MNNERIKITPEIKDRMQQMAADLAVQAGELRYVNYIILDPTRADPYNLYDFMPIYIGQTGDIAMRVKAHFNAAIAAKRTSGILRKLEQLLRDDHLPIFQIVECHRTRAACVKAETVWAQRLLHAGAALENGWPDQSVFINDRNLLRFQRQRLLQLTVGEALDANVSFEVACRKRCSSKVYSPSDLDAAYSAKTTLHQLRKVFRFCHGCGSLNQFAAIEGLDLSRR
ncbi:MAG: hypothetical protein DI568_16835 [Sphingomonas sp.]|nr:MAG: hypothetical protein DI568_16835 [Sphingomonas sp.]